MQTTPEIEALLTELYERSHILMELDGPQAEAWVSGLFDVFDETVTVEHFVDFCASKQTARGNVLCLVVAALTDDDLSQRAHGAPTKASVEMPAWAAQIGASEPDAAWVVEAPFGRSVVIGFTNPIKVAASDDEAVEDTAHSILVELGDDDLAEDLQLAGPPRALLAEAAAADERVTVREVPMNDAVALIVAAWPGGELVEARYGPGVGANQQFVRRRIADISDQWLPVITTDVVAVDIRRGLDDQEFADANRAALSTLQAAVGISPEPTQVALNELEAAWVGVVRGDGGDVSGREREALLWLEWADWLGACIGLLRAGVGSRVDGSALVDHVNRCPEVSSTIDKADRDYAEWAFGTAVDLLVDVGIADQGVLTQAGLDALPTALVAAWSPS